MHESWLNNTAVAMYGGRTVKEDALREEISSIVGRTPQWLKHHDDNPPWTISFAQKSPITLLLGTDSIIVSIQGTKFQFGTARPRAIPMKITAAYSVTKDAAGPRLMRRGEIQVLPPKLVAQFDKDEDGWLNDSENDALVKSGVQLTAQEVSLRNELNESFATMLDKQITPEPERLSGRWESLGQ